MKKTYANQCLERAENPQGVCLQYLRDVPELARRLKKACKTLRVCGWEEGFPSLMDVADELETLPVGEC